MKPINFHPNEVIYISPDPKILDLPVLQVQYSDGQTALLSCWKPSWKDRLRILFGKPIYAGLLSPMQPPIFISTEDELSNRIRKNFLEFFLSIFAYLGNRTTWFLFWVNGQKWNG